MSTIRIAGMALPRRWSVILLGALALIVALSLLGWLIYSQSNISSSGAGISSFWARAAAPVVLTCPLQNGQCTAALPDGNRLSLLLSPSPAKTQHPIEISIEFQQPVSSTSLLLAGESMYMGEFPLNLKPQEQQGQGGQHYRASTVLPICSEQRMTWKLIQQITSMTGQRYQLSLLFDSER